MEDGHADERAALEATVDRMRTELEGLRIAMRTRAVIEQAKGVLVERLGCTPEEAFRELGRRSQQENRKLAQLAADLVAAAAPRPAARPVAEDGPGAGVGSGHDPGLRESGAPASGAPEAEPDGTAAERAPGVGPDARPSTGEGAEDDEAALATRFHLAAAALATAAGPDELAERLYRAALAPLGAQALALAVREPDGALRLVGAHGVTARRFSQWQRIPPQTGLPMTEAVRTGRPVWVEDRTKFAARYPDLGGDDLVPGTAVCALPMRTGSRLLGALKIGWFRRHRPGPAVEAHLAALADLAADALLRLTSAPPDDPTGARSGTAPAPAPLAEVLAEALDPAGTPWFRAALDGLLDPVLVLRAIRGPGGAVADLLVEHANAATVDLADRDAADLRGRRLSELYPGMVSSGVFDLLRAAAAEAVPYRGEAAQQHVETVGGSARASAMTVCATPFQDGLLLTWRAHDDQDRQLAQVSQAARLARIGTWEWRPGERELSCSADVPALFGAPGGTSSSGGTDSFGGTDSSGGIGAPGSAGTSGGAGRIDPRAALAAVAPADRAAVRAAADELLAGRTPATVDFAVRAADGYRSLRVLGEATVAADGRLLAVGGVVQDVTPWRRAEQALSDTRGRLADQRRRTGDEQRIVRSLQEALMNAPGGRPVRGVESAFRYLPAERESKVGGDWYELLDLPDGTLLLAVGDVSGHGLPAAAAMSQLRYALRGIAYDGAPPDRVLDRLNRLLCHQRVDHLASVAVARLEPRTGRLVWARAGHLPPVLLHAGTVRPLEPPPGIVLGVAPRARYTTAEQHLAPGDRLLLYTDGLVERRGTDLGTGVDRLLRACADYRAPGLEGLLDHLLRRLDAPNPFDDTCLLAIGLTADGLTADGEPGAREPA
ncbi:SpoIIE family protein phosphatase [Kitasatospora sp. NPDC088391]|uniref:SpoIIE family protein phosphatase n=1 Tax=Kitasatospora sp. NPDC088391 TaxID=3364074 RepID=UPI003804AF5C